MNITFEKPDEVSGRLTVAIAKADYADEVKKQLRKLQKSAKMPGFRPGKVPMNMIERMYGTMVKGEEVEKKVSSSISQYIKENNVRLLGSPLPVEGREAPDIEKQDDFEFCVEMALSPEVKVELTDKDEFDHYTIEVSDKMIDDDVAFYRRQNGENVEVESYGDENDLLRGSLTELDEKGEPKQGGIFVEQVSLMPRFFVGEEQKDVFKEQGKKDATVVFSVAKAYEGKDSEIASLLRIEKDKVGEHTGNFAFKVASITSFRLADVNEDLFKKVYPVDTPKDEAAFRERIKKELERVYAVECDYRLGLDVRKRALEKAGELKVSEPILKRNLLNNMKKEEDKKNIDNIYKDYVAEISWSLVRAHLLEAKKVELSDDMLKETAREVARMQFVQYGVNNAPEELVENYSQRLLQDENQQRMVVNRAIERAFVDMAKKTVKLNEKVISLEEFNKLVNGAGKE